MFEPIPNRHATTSCDVFLDALIIMIVFATLIAAMGFATIAIEGARPGVTPGYETMHRIVSGN